MFIWLSPVAGVNGMYRQFSFLFTALAVAPTFAGPIAVTLSGNFGAPEGGSSVFDNQNYSINFLIPDPSSPSATTCCLAQISATYSVNAHLGVPGIGLALDDAVQVQYNRQLPLGKWLNIFSFTGLPVGDFMVLTPFQINNGELWNGLAGALGTPVITPLNGSPGAGVWHLEQNMLPIAVYPNGAMTITAAEVPEPAPVWLLAVALLLLRFSAKRADVSWRAFR
jgi:hypothetical protein